MKNHIVIYILLQFLYRAKFGFSSRANHVMTLDQSKVPKITSLQYLRNDMLDILIFRNNILYMSIINAITNDYFS